MNQITPVTRLADAPVSQAMAHPKRRKLLWASAALAAVLLAGGGVWVGMHHQPPPASMAAALPEVDVSAPLTRSLAQTTDFTGQFSAVDQVDLRAQVDQLAAMVVDAIAFCGIVGSNIGVILTTNAGSVDEKGQVKNAHVIAARLRLDLGQAKNLRDLLNREIDMMCPPAGRAN